MWEKKNPNKNNILQDEDYSNKILKKTLRDMNKKIPDKVIKELLPYIEDREIWPSCDEKIKNIYDISQEYKDINQEYAENVKKFFATPFSREDGLIKNIKKDFFKSINMSRKLKLNPIPKSNDLITLKTPLLMVYCEELEIEDFKSNQLESLLQAQRYFVNLKKYKINCNLPNNSKAKLRKEYQDIMKKFEQHSE